jgi:hypothetical protein
VKKWTRFGAPRREPLFAERKAPLLARIAGVAVVLVLGGVLAVWGVDLGKRIVGASHGEPSVQQQLAQAQSELDKVSAERDGLQAKGKPAAGAGAVSADAAALAAARQESARLAADIALLESVLPKVPAGAGLVIQGLQARMAAPGLLHYTILLGYGPKKGAPRQFTGSLRLAVSVSKDGKSSVLAFPLEKDAARYDISVQRNQRLDGTLELPAGVAASRIDISLVAGGKLVAKVSSAVKDLTP